MVVLVFGTIYYLHHALDLFLHVITAFFRCIGKAKSSFAEHLYLPVTVGSGRRIVHANDLFMDTEFR